MSDNQVVLSMLAEDERTISYRPQFAVLTDSAMAAILLQQMLFRWERKGQQPFYKFKEPCKQKLYIEGDSWCEELEWNPAEFDSALKIIGTKITKGVKKQAILDTELPVREAVEDDKAFYTRLQAALRCVILYWTDSNRVTWYQLNVSLLGKLINQVYLDKRYGLRYLKKAITSVTQKKRKSAVTSVPEIAAESPTEMNTGDEHQQTPEAESHSHNAAQAGAGGVQGNDSTPDDSASKPPESPPPDYLPNLRKIPKLRRVTALNLIASYGAPRVEKAAEITLATRDLVNPPGFMISLLEKGDTELYAPDEQNSGQFDEFMMNNWSDEEWEAWRRGDKMGGMDDDDSKPVELRFEVATVGEVSL